MTPHPPSGRSLIDHFTSECGHVKFQFVPQVYNLGRTLNQMGRFVPPILDFTFELAPGILSFLSHCTCFVIFFTMAETKKMLAIQPGVFEIWVYPFTR
ncbi:hypothetical protein M513_12346 [Trichuris suis]|uniref:Uncharacterized protein n=1 Tax=Trichuris suis TaxID=68888 RepID=A0A085LP69_9BILA|nr:hypothetical protein M513_12346 [Trichuris suis]